MQKTEVGQVYTVDGSIVFRAVKAFGGDVIQVVRVLGFQPLVVAAECVVFLGRYLPKKLS